MTGIDISDQMLQQARTRHSRPNLECRHRGILSLDPAEGRFDAVLSFAALPHAGPARRVAEHVRGLAAPGGRVVVVDMIDPGGWGERRFHLDRAFSQARLVHAISGDAEAAAIVLRQLLDPAWLAMAAHDQPLTREGFHTLVGEVFPGAVFTDDLHPLMAGFAWTAPTTKTPDAAPATQPAPDDRSGPPADTG